MKDTPRKNELKQNLLKTRQENRGLKRKLEDSFEEIKSMDNKMNQLSYQCEKTLIVLNKIEEDYGKVFYKLMSDTFDKDSMNKSLTLELNELQEKYDTATKNIEKAEKKIKKLNARNLKKKIKTRNKNI